MKEEEIEFSLDKILQEIPHFKDEGISEFVIHDKKFSCDKNMIIKFLEAVKKYNSGLFVSLPIQAALLDNQILSLLSELYSSIDIPLVGVEKNGSLLFDKKLYSSKARLLNDRGIVFGFDAQWGKQKGDTFKAFRDRLDFAVSLYPNHIDFIQFNEEKDPPSTAVYSSKDLDFSHGIAFACRTFYTCGRAVPWMNIVLKALKISPSTFFADFEEWQQCNSSSLESGFVPETESHEQIEKMQLLFLREKFEEKHKENLFPAIEDLVRLNGAFSRLAQEGQECVIETFYNPDDLLSPYSFDIASFVENCPMENCQVKIFAGPDAPDYKIL